MAGFMRKRVPAASRDQIAAAKILKNFYAPQKDTSKRYKRRVKLNNYRQEPDDRRK
jgi:hypothetical protein